MKYLVLIIMVLSFLISIKLIIDENSKTFKNEKLVVLKSRCSKGICGTRCIVIAKSEDTMLNKAAVNFKTLPGDTIFRVTTKDTGWVKGTTYYSKTPKID